MRRLSSSLTVFYKRVLPVVWCAFLLVFLVLAWRTVSETGLKWVQLLPFVLVPMLVITFSVYAYRGLIADLQDEVWLDGNWLVVVQRGERRRVALTDVVNVNASVMTNPRRITVLLRTDTRHGRTVNFIPASPTGIASPFRPDPIAADLIERVDALRRIAP